MINILHSRLHWVLMIVGVSAVPTLLSLLGVDFSSAQPVLLDQVTVEAAFGMLNGALHHALLEWTAVSIALLTASISIIHYRIHKDITAPIVGVAVFSAGMVDAFHTLAATRLIEAQPANTDFIPFTWALSRSFNAIVMIVAAAVSLWLFRERSEGPSGYPKEREQRNQRVLIGIASIFMFLAGISIYLALVVETLPKTSFPDAYIKRPFDVLPLALFLFGGTLYWIWYRQKNTMVRFALAMSIVPEVVVQLHMAFGSNALFDHHFNIAHGLKIFAYGIILSGFLIDFLYQASPQRADEQMPALDSNTVLFHVDADEMEVGRASRPLGVLLPVAAFLLALSVAVLVSFSFYFESERLIRKNSVEKLRIESTLVEPLLEQLYRQSSSDVLFLSQTPPVEGLIDSKVKGEAFEYDLWRDSLTIIFSEMLNSKDDYFRISYVGVADQGRELVSVVRNLGGVHSVPETLLRFESSENYYQSSLLTQPGATAISSVELKRLKGDLVLPHQPVVRVSTPIYDPETGDLFGIIIIHVDFGRFMSNLVENQLSRFRLYLSNFEGDYIYHPDSTKRFSAELGNDFYLQTEFPLLTSVIDTKTDEQGFSSLEDSEGNISPSYFLFIHLSKYGGHRPLLLLLQHGEDTLTEELQGFRNRSLILGVSLALIALALAVLFSRRVAHPLTKMTQAVQHYEQSGKLEDLPTSSSDEIGVLARSFHNLLQRMNTAMTDQQKMAMTYQETSDRLQAIVDSAVDAIVTIDQRGNIQSFNKAAEKMFGYQEQDVIGGNVKMLMPEAFSREHDQYIKNYETTGISKIIGIGRELTAKSRAGEEFPIHLAISKIELNEGVLYTGIIRDITSQKAAERSLIEGKEAAENAVRYKSEFLASMSHEIRTPMNGVLGMLGLLMRSELSKEQSHYAELARSSADSLLTIINDILDFSKIEAGRLDLEILDFNLNSQLGEFAESVSPKAQEKGLEVILDVTAVDRSMVKGDPGRIRQILSNLAGNSIKFTESGEVAIHASVVPTQDNKLLFSCSVTDTGIGIPEDKLGGLFESFTQVDASTTRKYGGTGLGLSIVKQLCELMNGRVWVTSEEHKGSCFSFEIELEESHQSEAILPSVDIRGSHMLIVDDNKTNREVLLGQLQSWGAVAVEADSAEQALDILESRYIEENSAEFVVAFLDMQMPDIDGMELGARIRSDARFDNMKLVMMTSMARRGDAQRFADLGFCAYFPKPTTTSDLFDALQVVMAGGDVLDQAQPLVTKHYIKSLNADRHQQVEHAQWSKSVRILLVEDNHINQAVALGVLEDFGLISDVAGNGIEALIAIKDAADMAPYHLVLMDCQMPDMDGYEATRQLREGVAGERAIEMPIIAMTANAMKGDREKCIDAGMSDYLTKPIDNDELEAMLIKWLPSELQRPTEEIEASSVEAETVDNFAASDKQPKDGAFDDSELWDKAGAMKRVRGKEERLIYLVELFVKDMPGRVETLQSALTGGDLNIVVEQAHAIKGISANLGALKLTDIAGELEQMGRSSDASASGVLSDSLQLHFSDVFRVLEHYLDSTSSSKND
ncbi:MAG: response regulator [Cellvibrionaceae bacterium]